MKKLEIGNKVAIVSLSSGMLGEENFDFLLKQGIKRIKEFGLVPVFMNNSLKGIHYIKENPSKRADDLKQAIYDDSIKAIICAIGGDDSYRTLPYLMDDPLFISKIKSNQKIFLGFSDSTINHLMFYNLGMRTFYGQSFICELCELENEMLPYSKKAFSSLFTGNFDLHSSEFWYEERKEFTKSQLGIDRIKHKEIRGIEVLQGSGTIEGNLLGGCLDSIYEILSGTRYKDQKEVCEKYELFPPEEEWKGKILFIETSEEKPNAILYRKQLNSLKDHGVFKNISGILVGKPQDEVNYELYKKLLIEIVDNKMLPILYNLNFGHALPRACFPYGSKVKIDLNHKDIMFVGNIFEEDE